MTLFNKKKTINTISVSLTEAKQIFDKLSSGLKPYQLFKEHDNRKIDIVEKESKRIENIIRNVISVKKGDITETNLKKKVTSDILDITKVFKGILNWDNNDPNNPSTYTQFENKFKEVI